MSSWEQLPKAVPPGERPVLDDADAAAPAGAPDKRALKAERADLQKRLEELQGRLYAEGTRALLVVLQGRDASGKDGVVRKAFAGVNPQGVAVTSFKAPTPLELRHDFLWRVHREVPPHGMIGIFNRSHYEDVLVVRVHGLAPEAVWSRRYDDINAFERLLTESGTAIVKLFLHISRGEQRRRLVARLDDPAKNWKFDAGDLAERARWDDYTAAYRDAIARCNSATAP
ncbi:MAG TPA: PPK2 family polyphosphate kinase, partial [Gemmatimonadales bacterium]|nr:PPK2 family polyphosphate kinase [Gemmatimonadales bacterium]